MIYGFCECTHAMHWEPVIGTFCPNCEEGEEGIGEAPRHLSPAIAASYSAKGREDVRRLPRSLSLGCFACVVHPNSSKPRASGYRTEKSNYRIRSVKF